MGAVCEREARGEDEREGVGVRGAAAHHTAHTLDAAREQGGTRAVSCERHEQQRAIGDGEHEGTASTSTRAVRAGREEEGQEE